MNLFSCSTIPDISLCPVNCLPGHCSGYHLGYRQHPNRRFCVRNVQNVQIVRYARCSKRAMPKIQDVSTVPPDSSSCVKLEREH